ncbi:LOW QUALITY PROTEIN: cytochrome c551 peroxidase [Vibrio sp. JCM 19052]|nr:LOW QUALITY PROTEIN: cytochrome c551 peroxidase [Vibrio sp. JCM 19052]
MTSSHGTHEVKVNTVNHNEISPIPQELEIDRDLAKIGWFLFRDPNLSSNKNVSCESCHSLQTNGAENTMVSIGVRGKGFRNSLTVFNTAFNYRFFWDGRVNNLHDQLDGPIHSVVEMDSNWQRVEEYVARSQNYNSLFSKANLDITTDNIKSSLVEFMKGLTTPNSPFDRYLLGDEQALTAEQVKVGRDFNPRGVFVAIVARMAAAWFASGSLEMERWVKERSNDTGRHLNTSKQEDMYLFRVASLRNVAVTAPYFHDGRTEKLEDAIKIMLESQLGRTFDQQTISDIKAFLTSLTGPRPVILEEFENE